MKVFNVIANNDQGIYKAFKVYGKSAKHAMERFDAMADKVAPGFEATEAHKCGEADSSGVL